MLSTAASAQTTGKGKQLVGDRFQRIELDKNDPEVQAIERSRPLGLFQGPVSHGDSRFLVDVDPIKMATAARKPSSRPTNRDRSAFRSKTISYNNSGPQATEFVIEYPSLNALLRCYWAYDQDLARRLAIADAKAREAALERNARHEVGSVQRLGAASSGNESKPARPSQLLISGDPEMGTLIRARRQFKKAGRPCQIEVVCASQASNRETFAKRMRLVQRERKACVTRAKELAAATRIIRTGE